MSKTDHSEREDEEHEPGEAPADDRESPGEAPTIDEAALFEFAPDDPAATNLKRKRTRTRTR